MKFNNSYKHMYYEINNNKQQLKKLLKVSIRYIKYKLIYIEYRNVCTYVEMYELKFI